MNEAAIMAPDTEVERVGPNDRRARTVPLRKLYTQRDLEAVAHLGSMPGAWPYVRGPYASMYTDRPWTIRQYTGHADAADSNLAFRTALEQGAQGLSVAFDLATQRGYDSDCVEAWADVGVAGVAIDTADDMVRLFDGIALDATTVSMTMNGAVLPIMAAFVVVAEEQGVPPERIGGTIQNDILKEYMVRNTWIFGPAPSMRIVADVALWLAEHAPRFNALSVSGYHFQEAGADAVLELALTLSNARAYVDTLAARGMPADEACSRLSFFFGVGSDFYTEIAKLRAARLLWAEIAHACGARSPRACALRMHCQTSGWSLTAQEAENNIVRVTAQAMAAAFGGTQSLHTNAYDEALALPSAAAARLARNTQLILQHETGLCDTVDPWAGSYMMESLTDDIATRVRAELAAIDAQGGVIAAIESGWVKRRLLHAAAKTQAQVDSGRRTVVGVNRFVASDPTDEFTVREMDGRHVRAGQARRIAAVKAARDPARVEAALRRLANAARDGGGNLLALAIDCMRARATVGECTRALESVWPRHTAAAEANGAGAYGDHRRGDAAWRAAKGCVGRLAQRAGRRPRIVIAKLGQDGHDRGAAVVAAALEDAGFDVLRLPLFQQPICVAAAVQAYGADIVGVSSLSGGHRELVEGLLDELASLRAGIPVVLGGIFPAADARHLKAKGVAASFGPGTPLDAIVEALCACIERARCVHPADHVG
ncbi:MULTISPECIES: methylmalonyl-CoA mutase [Burkholderia cepacia complex]|uniref:Methylmalonyl-CoA mutase n=1 Tax=Burkholderia ubonensis TaxID=101571 RepID=A0A1B4LHP4_9BURK|nr:MULTISPECIES: methylmalonyl-CoA mutase [Burkholderia cepacia complex]AOJ76625.1 methylmalonyl-CoA mutase [Burkholderia ubonensis]AOK13713.1 methylmalonyl-CoA mutase [Burkholderia vietnamiensis]KVF26466.1 methylmalonyl-CoA mutase [Burkholderia vietnamiensis]KVF41750.1 methylmalonyl-CoA mutase [Burkholderia vietnamiensis]MCA8287004.1 methylmalonyl-CoA mutase [Burkholderia vietnamiensis]